MIWVNLLLGFSDEVGLIKDVDNAGLDAITVAGGGGGGNQKAESVVLLANAISHVNSAVKNNVPSGSQSDVLPCTSTQSERDDWTFSQRTHIDDENKMLISHAHYLVGSTFTRGFFNLKGYLRSHFEENLYKCHWPGCGKGFAKEHDCK